MSRPYHKMTDEQKKLAHARNKRWKEKNKDKVKEYKKKHYAENRDKYLTIERDRAYRSRYGITLEDYNEMHEDRDGRCDICGTNNPGNARLGFLSVDHCHVTGTVRGLLCLRCNSSLGWFEKHSKEIINYLSGKSERVA